MTDDKNSPEEIQAFVRPFICITRYISNEFVTKANNWMFLVSDYGLTTYGKLPTSKEDFNGFFVACHDGWKVAQREIADYLIATLPLLAEAESELKIYRKQKDEEKISQSYRKFQTISLEIKIARRMLDVILWTIIQGEHSTLRRLQVKDGEHSLSVANIEESMFAAEQLNKNPLTIAVSCDMLSAVHVGDLFIFDGEKGQLTFAELKSGEKNIEITKLAKQSSEINCEHFENYVTSLMDSKEKSQYERVKRQAERNETIIATIKNEEGIDVRSGKNVKIIPNIDPPVYWSGRIEKCYQSLNDQKKWAIDVIDDCIYLGVYSSQESAILGFRSWLMNLGCESPISNIMDSFTNPYSRPLGYMMLSSELRKKIFSGEIIVVMCLDIKALIEIGNSIIPGSMRLSTKKEAARTKNQPFSYLNLYGLNVCIELGGVTTYMGDGIKDRILFDQQSPKNLLTEQLKSISSLKKSEKE